MRLAVPLGLIELFAFEFVAPEKVVAFDIGRSMQTARTELKIFLLFITASLVLMSLSVLKITTFIFALLLFHDLYLLFDDIINLGKPYLTHI